MSKSQNSTIQTILVFIEKCTLVINEIQEIIDSECYSYFFNFFLNVFLIINYQLAQINLAAVHVYAYNTFVRMKR